MGKIKFYFVAYSVANALRNRNMGGDHPRLVAAWGP